MFIDNATTLKGCNFVRFKRFSFLAVYFLAQYVADDNFSPYSYFRDVCVNIIKI